MAGCFIYRPVSPRLLATVPHPALLWDGGVLMVARVVPVWVPELPRVGLAAMRAAWRRVLARDILLAVCESSGFDSAHVQVRFALHR